MKKRKASPSNRRLMEHLSPREEWGPWNGFWATTYELNPEFLEVDFLPTFFDLGAWDDRRWSTRIALERSLAKLQASTVMIDAGRYHGRPRSLRVELIPIQGGHGGRLHAKVLLAVHERAVRLIVSSANLSEPGYRENREVAATLIATPEDPAAARLIRQAIVEGRETLSRWWSRSMERLAQTAVAWLEQFRDDQPPSSWFLWSDGNRPLIKQVLDRWPLGDSVERITIVSPFWSEETGNGPLASLVAGLKTRGSLAKNAEVRLLTQAQAVSDTAWRPVLPPSYGRTAFQTMGIRCTAQGVNPSVANEDVGRDDVLVKRRLHAKALVLEGRESSLAYFGSANFTHRGWGVGLAPGQANIEAGLLLLQIGPGRTALTSLIPGTVGDPVLLDGGASESLVAPEPPGEDAPWPTFLDWVRLSPSPQDPDVLDLVIRVEPQHVQGDWEVALTGASDGSGRTSLARGRQGDAGDVRTSLAPSLLSELLRRQEVWVTWWQHPQGSPFPLNVEESAREALPISPGSGLPGEAALISYYQGRIEYEDLFPSEDEPGTPSATASPAELSEVDKLRIQSYQIREFVEALEGLRGDLRNAAGSEGAMRLALLGPVSPTALSRAVMAAIAEGRRSPTAGAFQLVEILRCIEESAMLPGRDAWDKHRLIAFGQVNAMLERLESQHPTLLGTGTRFAQYQSKVLGRRNAAEVNG